MDGSDEPSSSLSVASSSYHSTRSNGHTTSSSPPPDPYSRGHPCLWSLSRLSDSLGILLTDAGQIYTDMEIIVEDVPVGVHRCILAARSPYFHDLFQKENARSVMKGKPRYLLSKLIPHTKIGLEAFTALLGYMYTGNLKASPPEVSTCVDESCTHEACKPAIDYALELIYASTMLQMKELVMLVQRHLLDFVEKAFIDNVLPIIDGAYRCNLSELFAQSLSRLARSDLDTPYLEKQLPAEVCGAIKRLRTSFNHGTEEEGGVDAKKASQIYRALDSDDAELVKLLVEESGVSLNDAHALHYAVTHCDPKVVSDILAFDLADVNLRNHRGLTPLHIAAWRKNPILILSLLNKGACVSDCTREGITAARICRKLTQHKDYHMTTKRGQECNNDRLCIDVLEGEMQRVPRSLNTAPSSDIAAPDLIMKLYYLEDRVTMAKLLFPREAKAAMGVARAESTSEFTGLLAFNGSGVKSREIALNALSPEQTKGLISRLHALQITVETAKRFFPSCASVLDKFLEDDMHGTMLPDNGTEDDQITKKQYLELQDDLMKAFAKDALEMNRSNLLISSPSSSPATSNRKRGKRSKA